MPKMFDQAVTFTKKRRAEYRKKMGIEEALERKGVAAKLKLHRELMKYMVPKLGYESETTMFVYTDGLLYGVKRIRYLIGIVLYGDPKDEKHYGVKHLSFDESIPIVEWLLKDAT